MNLLIGTRPVSLIDEPELCLHPPQAYEIGKFIGKNAVHDSHVTFVATHSSHVLRGILETAKSPQILRLTHDDLQFAAHFVPKEELELVLKHPKARAEAIFDGAYSQAVCLVEADGDRVVYQAALDDVGQTYKRSQVHFVPVSGTGGFVAPSRFFHKLRIPFAVIADLEFVLDEGKVAPVLDLLYVDAENRKEILGMIPGLLRELEKIEPSIKEQEVTKTLDDLSERTLNWENRDDIAIKRVLTGLAEKLKRRRRLKDGGVDAYSQLPAVFEPLTKIVAKCHSVGLFLVPVGELECWVRHLMTDVTESGKPERAMIAAAKIRDCTEKKGDIWAFMEKVLEFLTRPR
jgi:hypothetical protein